MNQDDKRQIMQIIIKSGESKKIIKQAMDKARQDAFEEANQKLDEANAMLIETHAIHTSLLGSDTYIEDINILSVHAEDHLMTTMTLLDVSKELVFMYEKFTNS